MCSSVERNGKFRQPQKADLQFIPQCAEKGDMKMSKIKRRVNVRVQGVNLENGLYVKDIRGLEAKIQLKSKVYRDGTFCFSSTIYEQRPPVVRALKSMDKELFIKEFQKPAQLEWSKKDDSAQITLYPLGENEKPEALLTLTEYFADGTGDNGITTKDVKGKDDCITYDMVSSPHLCLLPEAEGQKHMILAALTDSEHVIELTVKGLNNSKTWPSIAKKNGIQNVKISDTLDMSC